MKSQIKSVKDAEEIHARMVKLDMKMKLGNPYDMPHYRGEQKLGWDVLPNILRLSSIRGDKSKAKELEKKGW